MVDTDRMINIDFAPEHEQQEWKAILTAYQTEQQIRKLADPEHDGWIERLTTIPNIDPEISSQIHGKLIAFGYLKFQLVGRTTGVQYQLSNSGKQLLQSPAPPEETENIAA